MPTRIYAMKRKVSCCSMNINIGVFVHTNRENTNGKNKL